MRRTIFRSSTVLAALAVAVAVSSAPASAARRIEARRVISGLNVPTAFTFGPGRVIWYVQKGVGEIRTRDLGSGTDSVFATVPGLVADGERGMLGIALDPAYPAAPFVYVYATRSVSGSPRNQILRFTDAGGSGTNRRVIWSAPSSASNHNGGHIAFGPGGLLYAVVGDGGSPANSQDLTANDRGKVLRMTATGRAPGGNPFGNRIYSYGLRNSFGFAFDPRTGRLWETENGPECNDELNRILRGRNYGWGPHETCSGTAPRNTNRDGPRPVMPERWYTPTIAPTGAAFCDGCGLGRRSAGALFFGAHNTGQIRRVILNAKRTDVRRQRVVYRASHGILSIEVGPRGRLYFSDDAGIYRLVRP
jgi:glucose/arabinose dehydrogenase